MEKRPRKTIAGKVLQGISIAAAEAFKIWLKGRAFRVNGEIWKVCQEPGRTEDEILKLIENKNN